MKRIGLIDVDGHHFPNLALMRISSWHKSQGDVVEWWWSDFVHYDVVYMSKVFSSSYSPDVPEPMNADKIIKGGTGYCISLGDDGKEHFDQSKNENLSPEKDYRKKTVYVLTNYNSTMEENLYRIYTLRDLDYSPYVMIYNKPSAPREIRLLQRWCNNKFIFRSEPDFNKYDPRKG